MYLASHAHRCVGEPLDAAVRCLTRRRIDDAHTTADLQRMLLFVRSKGIKDDGHLVVLKRTVLRQNTDEDITRLIEVAAQANELRPRVDDIVAVDEVVRGLPLRCHVTPQPLPCAAAVPRT